MQIKFSEAVFRHSEGNADLINLLLQFSNTSIGYFSLNKISPVSFTLVSLVYFCEGRIGQYDRRKHNVTNE